MITLIAPGDLSRLLDGPDVLSTGQQRVLHGGLFPTAPTPSTNYRAVMDAMPIFQIILEHSRHGRARTANPLRLSRGLLKAWALVRWALSGRADRPLR